MSLVGEINKAKKALEDLYKDDQAKTQAEAKVLLNASLELSRLENLQMEADIESQRAVRKYMIESQTKRLQRLQQNYETYVLSLPSKTQSSFNKRKEELKKHWMKDKNIIDGKYIVIGSLSHFRDPVSGKWYRNIGSRVTFPEGKDLVIKDEHYWLKNHIVWTSKYVRNYDEKNRPSSSVTRNMEHYISKYSIPVDLLFNMMWDAYYQKGILEKIAPDFSKQLKNSSYREYNSVMDLANNPDSKIISNFTHVYSALLAGNYNGFLSIMSYIIPLSDVINYFYPPVDTYMKNPELFPHAKGFMEEVPWPSSKQLAEAMKPIVGVGTPEWGEKQITKLKNITEDNLKSGSTKVTTLALPTGYTTPEGEFVTIPYFNYIPSANPNPDVDPANDYYSPRPKGGYIYVPGFDYINPMEYVSIPKREVVVNTPKGDYEDAVEKARREAERQAREQRWNTLKGRISSLASGGLVGMIFNPTGFMEAVACSGYGEDSHICKFTKDTGAVTRTLTKTWVAAAAGSITGGTGGAIAGAVTSIGTAEGLNIANSDLGKVLLALAEAYAIANVTNSAIDKALTEVLENQIHAIAKREIGKATGLDQTLLGRVGLDLTTGGAFRMYKGEGFTDAIVGSADKAWRLSVARENPYGALLVAGVTEIEKNNWSINSTNPMDWFDNINVGDEFQRIRQTARGRDIAKLIGLTYMTQAGMISNEQALLMVGQEASKRNIENFYQDKPLVEDPEMAAYREKREEVNRWKLGIRTLEKLDKGIPPTKEDIMILTDNVAGPIYDRVQSLGLPQKVQVNFWKIAVEDIGLPNIPQFVPDASFTMPDWMKSSKSSGEVTFFNEESVQNYLDEKYSVNAELTKEDIVELILRLLPAGTPLVPIARGPQVPHFNFIDEFGKLNIRPPLNFPYDHPMLSTGRVKKRYTEAQKKYMMERERELKAAQERLAAIQSQLSQLESQMSLS